MRYFTSDWHFFDDTIRTLCERPFASACEMNASIVKRFVESTRDATEVFFLGDLFGKNIHSDPDLPARAECAREWLAEMGAGRLPFRLVRGNHDTWEDAAYRRMGFASIDTVLRIEMQGIEVFLSHDPCMAQSRGSRWVCGHLHALYERMYNAKRNIAVVNACIEVCGYKPLDEQVVTHFFQGVRE